jgi:hypothetical protein
MFRLRLRLATSGTGAGGDDVGNSAIGRAEPSAQEMANRKDGQAIG